MFGFASTGLGSAVVGETRRVTLDQKAPAGIDAMKAQYRRPVSIPFPKENPYTPEKMGLGKKLYFDTRISVTSAQSQAGLSEIQSEAASSASQEGYSSATALFLGNGISPQMLPDLGTWVAQETAFELKANGGTQPTSTAQGNAVTAKYNKAECQAAKTLNIQVSPQFGRLDYSTYTVVPAKNTLSQPAGVPSPASTTGLTPAC